MKNNIAKIRAALELSSEFLAQPQHAKQLLQVMEALAALAELERAASEPVAWRYRYVDGKHGSAWLTNSNPPPKGDAAVADVELLYAAPPAKPAMGIFTAEEAAPAVACASYVDAWKVFVRIPNAPMPPIGTELIARPAKDQT